MKIYMETFGCTFNQADSQIMAGLLEETGGKIVKSPEEADVIIINTCYVKQPTEQKITNRIGKMQAQFPQKKLLIAGCMVDIDPEKLKKLAPQAGWIGARRINSAPEVVEAVMNGHLVRETGHGDDVKTCLPRKRSNPLVHILQICEGCLGKCSYCCTRFARGRLQSYPVSLLRAEAEQAVADGCVEIQLTAQDTAAYGKDTGENLSDLINQITSIEGDFLIRVGMMHPKNIEDDLEAIITSFKNEKVYNFLHLPLQSGSNQILSDMNRGHTVEEYLDIVNHFRTEIPELSLATDVIVGYPTEDDDAFQDTLDVIQEIYPDFLHISKYHHRPGTRSSLLPEIDHQTMKKRSRQLNDLKVDIATANNRKLRDTHQKILITDKGSKGGYIGRTNSYKTVVVEEALPGAFLDVEITHSLSTYLKGKISK
ncbi:tRNA (N(6)-L-threonylcarbamoyladenosine(37)-C(2))-methylthiotransferase [Methanobacterium sp.]|uniref:tRNA (N(6)-L-threonylcarbamoyladenosine(37)-C(2))- methylthiotransferase n=1 Tax=Methanobacterium sp. TaxID=2164 RepID=UPI0025F48A3E|nr:tRNA (N(6)-L-threonylcarbamoyladenosine(37)-C(2))-methylthiotransferase [Methanobacterium sp.]MBI5460532.1 tRNA (N(6)-L-threonylcarbamoyladenosine(37)-C(2))-methylthiotransferase [Methanobacterium sp.]